jgi:hypothetical protein
MALSVPVEWDANDLLIVSTDMNDIRDSILRFANVQQQGPITTPAIRWPSRAFAYQYTSLDPRVDFGRLTEEAKDYIAQQNLLESALWLQVAAPAFFNGAVFEIDLLPADPGESDVLALRVYGSFDASDFRDLRHDLCRAMIEAGHSRLHSIISIFQRRVHNGGWQGLPLYGALSAQ